MSNFSQEIIEINQKKQELYRKANCIHNALYSGKPIPSLAFPFLFSYLFEINYESIKINDWIYKNKRKIITCKDPETKSIIQELILRDELPARRTSNYTEQLIQKQRKRNPESNSSSDIEETLKYLFANLENWETSPLLKGNATLLKYLQTEFNTDELDIYVLLQQKKEQLLNKNSRK